MKNTKRTLRWVGLVLLVVLAYTGYRIGWGKPFTINQLSNRQAILYLIKNPELFTEVGIVDGTLLDWHSGKLAEVGVRKRDDDLASAQKFADQVRQFDRSRLDLQDQVTYDITLGFWETALSFRRFDWLSSEGLYPIAPMWGSQVQLPLFLETTHVVRNAKLARNYVKRLEAAAGTLDALTAEMLRQAGAGVVLPLSLLERSQSGIRDTTSTEPAANALVATFVDRMKQAKGLTPDEQTELARQATAIVRDRIYPAFARMTAALETQRPAAAAQSAGVARLPDGAAYYAAALKAMTTTDYTPAQVHELGLTEVARISTELDSLLTRQGLAGGAVGQRVQALHKDPRFLLPNTDAGRAQLISKYQQILDDVNARMPEYFRSVPSDKLLVKRVPALAENSESGAYYDAAALDGSRAATFFANLRDVGETATWTMKTLAYHEGIPGHHFQIATAQNLKGMPVIRQEPLFSAYTEGWALYAERLAAEIGMYKDDPFGDIGRLESELFRAARLVVDTGLHAQGWSREQAIAYMVTTTGMNESEVVTEVERYMGQPGQACAYKVGQLKILELRERAKAALGPRFDLRDFHAVVLENGAVPLASLEKLVDAWIARTKPS